MAVADVHKILVSAAKLHEKGHTSWLGPGGGEIIPLNHPVSKAMITAYHKAVDEFDKMGIIPVYEENGVYNFYLTRSGWSRVLKHLARQMGFRHHVPLKADLRP